jgi:hypothetical protein
MHGFDSTYVEERLSTRLLCPEQMLVTIACCIVGIRIFLEADSISRYIFRGLSVVVD